MKIRNGFISNSSSSSFIVRLPKKPKTFEELKNSMFPNKEWTDRINYEYLENESLTVAQVIKQIFNDIEINQKDATNIKETMLSGYIREIEDQSSIKTLKNNWDIKRREEYHLYHQFGKKYGYELADMKKWKKDKHYPEYLKKQKIANEAEKEYVNARNSAISKYYENFKERNIDRKFEFAVEYSDKDGPAGCIMEHGDIFENVPHLTISHH